MVIIVVTQVAVSDVVTIALCWSTEQNGIALPNDSRDDQYSDIGFFFSLLWVKTRKRETSIRPTTTCDGGGEGIPPSVLPPLMLIRLPTSPEGRLEWRNGLSYRCTILTWGLKPRAQNGKSKEPWSYLSEHSHLLNNHYERKHHRRGTEILPKQPSWVQNPRKQDIYAYLLERLGRTGTNWMNPSLINSKTKDDLHVKMIAFLFNMIFTNMALVWWDKKERVSFEKASNST